MPFRIGEQREGADRCIGIGDDALQQPQEMARHSADRGFLEEGAVILKPAVAAGPVRLDVQGEIVGSPFRRGGPAFLLQSRQCQPFGLVVLQQDAGLKHRRMRATVLGCESLDEFLEGQFVVGHCVFECGFDLPQQFAEPGVARPRRAQRKHVDETADEIPSVPVFAIHMRDANDDVVLAAHPHQQDLECGQERREQAYAFGAQRTQSVQQVRGQGQ